MSTKKKTVKMTVRLREDTHAKAVRAAAKESRSLNSFSELAIRERAEAK